MQAGVSHRRQAESANYYQRSSTPKFEADLVGIQRRRSPRDLSAILALCLSLSLTNPNSTAGQLWSLRYKWNDAPRVVKWSTMIGCVLVLFGKDGWNWACLNSCCFYRVIQRMKRKMIRRKLPISRWPRRLYLRGEWSDPSRLVHGHFAHLNVNAVL